jgi:hypothetical protein
VQKKRNQLRAANAVTKTVDGTADAGTASGDLALPHYRDHT